MGRLVALGVILLTSAVCVTWALYWVSARLLSVVVKVLTLGVS